MLPTTINFKERMAEARRTQILIGAAQVFAEKGFHKATTKEIAKAAGISEGTIYNYFNNKRELLFAMIELIGTQSLKSIIIDDPPGDPQEFFTAILHDRYQLLQQYGYLLAPIMAEVFADVDLREQLYQQIAMPIFSYVEKYIQTHIDSGRFRQINPVIITRAFIGAMIVNFALKLTHLESRYENISPEEMIEQLVSLLLGVVASNE